MVGSRSKREPLKATDDENIISLPSIQPRRRPRSGDASQPESRYSSFPAYYGKNRHRPIGLLSQRCLRGGRVLPQHSTKGRPVLSPMMNCFLVLSLLIAWLRLGTSLDDVVGLPEWIPLMPEGRAGENAVAELFGSGEVLQMFHLQATAQLYEQGGLNHDLSFMLTAVAFFSLDRPDAKVSMAYHPTNMTISLLPTISEDGRELQWAHQSASVSYTLDIDQAYWSGTAYMGQTTGAFFSNAVESSLEYLSNNPRYQPFSVYQEYPGAEFLAASSCDEYVWTLLVKAQELGVHLTPTLLPKKHKIIIYTQTRPERIQLDGGDGDENPEDREGDSSGAGGGGTDSASSSSPSSWRSSSSSASNADEVDRGDGKGRRIMSEKARGEGAAVAVTGSAGSDNERRLRVESRSEHGLGERQRLKLKLEVERATAKAEGISTGSRLLLGEEEEEGGGQTVLGTPAPSATAPSSGPGQDGGGDDEQDLDGVSEVGGDGDGSYATVASVENEEQASTEPEMEYVEETSYAVGEGGEEGAGAGDSEVAASPTTAGNSTETLQPTASPTEAEDGSEDQQPLDEWPQVVAYYQSLQMCLQERKFSYVTSLKDFAEYFDCLDDVAFISLGPHEYYKVNLTSTRLDHVSLPEDLPPMKFAENDVKLPDFLLMLWVLLIILCGVHGMLWQGGVMQHWMKASGYGQVAEENNNADDDLEDGGRSDRQPSLTQHITSEYLRLGQRFLGKHEEEIPPPGVADGSGDGIASSGFSPASAAGSGAGAGIVADGGVEKRSAARAINGRRSLETGGGYHDWVEEPDHDLASFVEGGGDEHDNDNGIFFDSRLEDAGWSRGGRVREKSSRRGTQERLPGDGAPPAARSAAVAGEQEGLEMGSAAAWRQRSRTVEERPSDTGALGETLGATGVEVDGGIGGRADAVAREGSALRGLRGKRRSTSYFPPGWSDAAVAWGTNYNDGGRDHWIRFPESPPQRRSKPGGVRLSRDVDGEGGGDDLGEGRQRRIGSQMETYGENGDDVPLSSEGSRPRRGGDGADGAEEKLDSTRLVAEESTPDPKR